MGAVRNRQRFEVMHISNLRYEEGLCSEMSTEASSMLKVVCNEGSTCFCGLLNVRLGVGWGQSERVVMTSLGYTPCSVYCIGFDWVRLRLRGSCARFYSVLRSRLYLFAKEGMHFVLCCL